MKLGIASLVGGVAMLFAVQAFASDVECKAVDPATKKVIADASASLVSKCNRKVREDVKKKMCTPGTKKLTYELQAVKNGKAQKPSERTVWCDGTSATDDDKDDKDEAETKPSTGGGDAKEGDKASVTAYLADGKTVVTVVACEVGALGPEYPKCVAKTKEKIKPTICKGKKGRQQFKYRMGDIKTVLGDNIDCG